MVLMASIVNKLSHYDVLHGGSSAAALRFSMVIRVSAMAVTGFAQKALNAGMTTHINAKQCTILRAVEYVME